MSTPTNRPPARFRSQGVTMLELLVVLVIVGILSGLAVVKYNTFQRKAELRSSAQKFYQILGWARIESEKRGDTLLVYVEKLPEIGVYVDQNANGVIDPSEPRILMDSLARSVQVFVPKVAPEHHPAAPQKGLDKGDGISCGFSSCCNQNGTNSVGTWTPPTGVKSGIAVCARNLPKMPSTVEAGAIYLESSEANIQEKWTVIMAPNRSKNATLWSVDKPPTDSSQWRLKR